MFKGEREKKNTLKIILAHLDIFFLFWYMPQLNDLQNNVFFIFAAEWSEFKNAAFVKAVGFPSCCTTFI